MGGRRNLLVIARFYLLERWKIITSYNLFCKQELGAAVEIAARSSATPLALKGAIFRSARSLKWQVLRLAKRRHCIGRFPITSKLTFGGQNVLKITIGSLLWA